MAEDYYTLVAKGVTRYRPDIVGHFDLITKFNRLLRMFDEESKSYQEIALDYLDEVVTVVNDYGGMVEINTSGMLFNRKDVPYCGARFLLDRLKERKVRVIITGDSHAKETLNFGFERAFDLLKAAGFSSMAVLKNGTFCDIEI